MSDQHAADAAFEAWCEEQPSWPWRRTSPARFAFHAGQHARQPEVERLEAKLTEAITERVEAEEDRDRFQGAAERLEARVRELEATVQRYEAPGGWTFLREIEARRVLGDPMQGVSLTARGTFLEPPHE